MNYLDNIKTLINYELKTYFEIGRLVIETQGGEKELNMVMD